MLATQRGESNPRGEKKEEAAKGKASFVGTFSETFEVQTVRG